MPLHASRDDRPPMTGAHPAPNRVGQPAGRGRTSSASHTDNYTAPVEEIENRLTLITEYFDDFSECFWRVCFTRRGWIFIYRRKAERNLDMHVCICGILLQFQFTFPDRFQNGNPPLCWVPHAATRRISAETGLDCNISSRRAGCPTFAGRSLPTPDLNHYPRSRS